MNRSAEAADRSRPAGVDF